MTTNKPVVLITGASRGLGRKLALGFGRENVCVAVHYNSQSDAANEVVEEILERGGEALTAAADLSESTQTDDMIRQVLEVWGRVDILINNAGLIEDGPVVSLTEKAWDHVLGVNLSGPFYTMRAVSMPMKEQGGGAIVNIVSRAGAHGNAGQSNYAAAKAGMMALTKAAASEWGPYHIRINAVSPGFMETDMTKGLSSQVKKRAVGESCLDALCDPDDVVEFIKLLVRMKSVTGQVFFLDSRMV